MLKWALIILWVLVSIALFSGVSIAESSTGKGVYSLSGGVAYTHIEGQGDSYSIAPSGLYFVSDNIGLGISVAYGRSDYDDYTITSKGIGPAIRWYFPLEQKIFVEASYKYTNYDTDRSYVDTVTTYNQWNYVVGADFFISRNVAIEPSFYYRDYDRHADYQSGNSYDNSTQYFGFSVGINVFIY